MGTALLAIAAVLLDAAVGEPRRWHPLVGFGRWAQYWERVLNPEEPRRPLALRLRGVLALLIALMPWVLLIFAMTAGAYALVAAETGASFARCVDYFVSTATLYFALGHQSLRDHAQRVHEALIKGELVEARERGTRPCSH
jgi:adenosylcobinamide-phosphate synthase